LIPDDSVGFIANSISRHPLSLDEWDSQLRAAGFSGNDAVCGYPDSSGDFSGFTLLSSAKVNLDDKPAVSLLVADTPGSWAISISDKLTLQGHEVRWTTLHQELPTNEWIVILLDLDGPYLHNATAENFIALQSFLTKLADRHRTLWVTRTSQLSCEDPRFGLIFGLARTLRQEQMLDISTFETSRYDEQAADALSNVLEKLMISRSHADVEPEYEFSYRDEVLIARCHWGTSEDKMFTSQPREGTARKLAVGSFSQVDTLEWAPYELSGLPASSVEIEMHYIGLNFRVRLFLLPSIMSNVLPVTNRYFRIFWLQWAYLATPKSLALREAELFAMWRQTSRASSPAIESLS
jgi:hypothetical protein